MTKPAGNMYEWIGKTVNPLAGECSHKCSYCYANALKKRYSQIMKKYSGEPRIDEWGLKQLAKGEMIFVCSMNDLFAENVPESVINEVLKEIEKSKCQNFLLQTKNPMRVIEFIENFHPNIAGKVIICTTIESDIFYPEIMGNAPEPKERAFSMGYIVDDVGSLLGKQIKTQVTIEPILKFNLDKLVNLIRIASPGQVNIGAESGRNNLPEPSGDEIRALIIELEKFTVVKQKSNLKRLLK